MKFLLINDTDELTGGAAVIFDLQRQFLQELGHEVFTICFSKTIKRDNHHLRLPVTKNWYLRKWFKLTFHPIVYYRLRSFINEIQPDLVIIHNNALYPSTVLLACRGYPVVHVSHDFYLVCPTMWAVQKRTLAVCSKGINLKCITHCYISPLSLLLFHVPLFFIRRALLKRIVRILIAPSQSLTEYLWRFGYTAKLLRNPVPFDILESSSKCTHSVQPNTPVSENPYILYVGLLSDNKGVDCLIRAFAILYHNGFSRLRLKVAGDGPSRKALEGLAKDLGVINAIEFLGTVSRSNLYDLYREAVALVVPSLWQENFPTVVSEAMACGCPVIGSARGGIPEMLGKNQRGLLFKPGDAEDLADKIIMLLCDQALRHKLTMEATYYVHNTLNPRIYIQKLMGIVYEVIHSTR